MKLDGMVRNGAALRGYCCFSKKAGLAPVVCAGFPVWLGLGVYTWVLAEIEREGVGGLGILRWLLGFRGGVQNRRTMVDGVLCSVGQGERLCFCTRCSSGLRCFVDFPVNGFLRKAGIRKHRLLLIKAHWLSFVDPNSRARNWVLHRQETGESN